MTRMQLRGILIAEKLFVSHGYWSETARSGSKGPHLNGGLGGRGGDFWGLGLERMEGDEANTVGSTPAADIPGAKEDRSMGRMTRVEE
jgi:hypothetical protein